MAKSQAQQIHDLVADLKVAAEREAAHRRDLERLAAKQEKADADLRDLRQENAVFRQRLDDHLKRVEEWDRRRWGLYGLLAGAILSFAANVIVALVRR